jgi:predicted porin
MMEVGMMKRISIGVVLFALALVAGRNAEAAFVVGGENGWQLSTDGIVDIFTHYRTTSSAPAAASHPLSLLGDNDQNFGVTVGLLPSVVAFNIKAPTVNGVDSAVRIGIYPSVQNKSQNSRLDTNPNIDFREIYYTAKGKYGELLAGRALNLYQGKNILTDMTLLTAGVVPGTVGSTTLGHIGYGYLYTNFGPQIRYTTPDLNGVKVAFSVNEPYKISADTAKTPSPRIETEISYATVLSSGKTFQSWLSALYQSATRSSTAAARPGEDNESVGGAAGVEFGFSGVDLLASGYLGEGLGVVSVQDGDFGTTGLTSTDFAGKERTQWGFLAQATYMLTPTVKIGANYGQTRLEKTDNDKALGATIPFFLKKKQEAAVAMVTYNFNKFTQFIAEYTYAQDTWHDGATQHSNSFALGTMFYW